MVYIPNRYIIFFINYKKRFVKIFKFLYSQNIRLRAEIHTPLSATYNMNFCSYNSKTFFKKLIIIFSFILPVFTFLGLG